MSHQDGPMRPYRYGSAAISPVASTYTVSGPATRVVRLQPSIDCWVVFGSASVTPTTGLGTNAMPLTALHGAQTFMCAPNDIISIICNDGVSSGFMSVVEMSR